MPQSDCRRARTSEVSIRYRCRSRIRHTSKAGRSTTSENRLHDIASQHADVQRFWLCEGGILTAKSRFGSIVTSQSDLRTNHHGLGNTANATQVRHVLARREAKSGQVVRAECRAIGTGVDQEPGRHPSSAGGADLPAHHGPDDSVVASVPDSVKRIDAMPLSCRGCSAAKCLCRPGGRPGPDAGPVPQSRRRTALAPRHRRVGRGIGSRPPPHGLRANPSSGRTVRLALRDSSQLTGIGSDFELYGRRVREVDGRNHTDNPFSDET